MNKNDLLERRELNKEIVNMLSEMDMENNPFKLMKIKMDIDTILYKLVDAQRLANCTNREYLETEKALINIYRTAEKVAGDNE